MDWFAIILGSVVLIINAILLPINIRNFRQAGRPRS